MKPLLDTTRLDTILPGVAEAYASLRSREGRGLYTSRGRFYNHTIFGRDSAMAAKFVADFDHQMATEVIYQLIALQGTEHNPKTQEAPGRIHHEWRNFTLWNGRLMDRLPFWLLKREWDIRDGQLLSYFSLDTTASFIRLVHKYASRIDVSILERKTRDKHGQYVTVAHALELAASWLTEHIDENGLLTNRRLSGRSLPVQTFQDSLYARSDGSLIDLVHPVAYIEVQAFTADALRDMAHLFPQHPKAREWRETASALHRRMLFEFQQPDNYYASARDTEGQVDVANISAGWILNTFLWRDMTDDERAKHIVPIVERLFSDDFLTPVGLRTRARNEASPIKKVIDYHGSETVWPMFSFMVVEGLRRHRLYDLADQLEHRITNGLNATGGFPEFHIVTTAGALVLPSHSWSAKRLRVQMKPERDIAFSVVPALLMARRAIDPPERKAQRPWQIELEERVLSTISSVKRVAPGDALATIGTVERARLVRWPAGLRTFGYFWRQRRSVFKMPH